MKKWTLNFFRMIFEEPTELEDRRKKYINNSEICTLQQWK